MKKTFTISVLFLIISFAMTSCDNDDSIGESEYITASINNKDWSGTPEIYFDTTNDSLTLLGYGNDKMMSVKIKFNGVGTYNLENSQATYYTTVGGDVITSNYTTNSNSNSYLNITEYDSEINILKGEFELSLIKEWSNP